jgi:CheY-like chemotaxis protein
MVRAKILLVDDEKDFLDSWKKLLESVDYDVKIASSGKEAIELVKQEKPDIVFTDLVMPGMDGVEVCKTIKKLYPDVLVVFISGYPFELENNLVNFIKAGGKDMYLRKPLYKEELFEAINKLMYKEELFEAINKLIRGKK